MEIEIPAQFYELLLIEAAQTDSATGAPLAVEEIVESAFKKYLERNEDNVD